MENVSSYHNLSHYMKIHVFWDVTKRRLNCYRCFEGKLSLQLQGQAHETSFEQWVTIYRLTRQSTPPPQIWICSNTAENLQFALATTSLAFKMLSSDESMTFHTHDTH